MSNGTPREDLPHEIERMLSRSGAPAAQPPPQGQRPRGVPPDATPRGDYTWQSTNYTTGRVEIYGPDWSTVNESGVPAYGIVRDYPIPEDDESGLAETMRHNRASEAISLRQLALEAASKALSGYLDATKDIAARRKGAVEEARLLLPMAMDPAQAFFGHGPGGPLSQEAERYGLSFQPPPVQHKQIAPGTIAEEGPISPEVQAMLAGIRGA